MKQTVQTVLQEARRDGSDWSDVAHYPDTETLRNLLALADFASVEPARWAIIRDAFLFPELSQGELASLHKVCRQTVGRALAPVDLTCYLNYY